MNLTLVDNLVMPEEGSLAVLDVHPHLGLLSLAAAAQTGGHRVRIYDPKRLIKWGALTYDESIYESAAADLLAKQPDAVGFTTLGCSFLFAVNVAAELKRREPYLPILLGGPHATMLHERILGRFPQFDVIVRHEADETITAVLDKLEQRQFAAIPGISWRGSRLDELHFNPGAPKVDDLDSLPLLPYDLYPVAELGLDLLRIEAGRGCPFMCTFCSTASFFQRSFRIKSAERLVLELDRLHERYGYSDFKLDHDLFTVNRRKVREFCEAVKGRGYRWCASARVDCVNPELLRDMAAAGCTALYFGIETGSTRMQKISKKRLDLDLVEPILDVCRDVGIDTTASFITGFPEGTEEDQADTLDLVGRCLRRGCLPQLHLLVPEPGTPLFATYGERLQYDGYTGPYNARPTGADDERLVLSNPQIFSTYHHYPAEVPRAHDKFAASAVDILRRLGPLVGRYLLRAYGGRLSVLVFASRAWVEDRGVAETLTAQSFEAYVSDTFGATHHLTSLVRYALRATCDSPPTVGASAQERTYDAHRIYRLSAGTCVLDDLHDCAHLLERIGSTPDRTRLLDDADAGERGMYLLNVAGTTSACYRINAGVEAVLSLFTEPRTCSEAATLIRDATGAAQIDPGLFESFVTAGILVAGPAIGVAASARTQIDG